MTKEHILSEIRRTASANGGTPLGVGRFVAETGIKSTDWLKHWARWGEAIRDAGLTPNQLQASRTDEDLLIRLAVFVRELGRFPAITEINLKARTDPGFPWSKSFTLHFGGKAALATRLQQFCQERGEDDVAALCADAKPKIKDESNSVGQKPNAGYVYLLRHGSRREYKIGRTNNPMRREGEIRTELPEQLTPPVHKIITDDPVGIERYWHQRFAEKRKNGEWFALDIDDIRAFKRWRTIY